MAKEGKNGREIAAALGMNEKTVYGSSGWKRAKKEEVV